MSCSQFIEHEDEDKSDTLVIIVNGDGTVTVDPNTLERVLSNQCRAAVSVIRKLEDSDDEPDSLAEKVREKNDKSSDEKDSFCHKVNLVVEGYYPPPPLNSNSKTMSSDSVVSSTVGTPPLPQTSSEFYDYLAEGLDLPGSQSNSQTPLEDSLTMNDDPDDWIHFDHCYTVNCYGNRKQQRVEHKQDSGDVETSGRESTAAESGIDDVYETLSDMTSGGLQRTDSISKKKSDVESSNKAASGSKKSVLADVKLGQKRSPIHIISKVKKKSSSKNDLIESTVPERIVKEDEVDGVKVFKPTKSDKRLPKSLFSKDLPSGKTPLVQTKLNFGIKKEEASGQTKKPPIAGDSDISASKPGGKNGTAKKDAARKSVTPEIFGPALFSTPDIIRKIGSDDTSKESCNISSIDTADLEKRMSAIENGELLENMTLPYVEQKPQKVEEKMPVQDDSRLLSDLENSADELTQAEETVVGLSNSTSDRSSRRKSTESEQSDFSDKNDAEYEDDPNKLWCICNKPHNNRFMICCDACDNWFHGYCVGITKAMGEKMEQNGTEWLCPSCKKEKTATERDSKHKLATRALANRSAGKRRSSQAGGDSSNSNVSNSSTPIVETSSPSLQQSVVTEKSSVSQAAPVAAAANVAVNRRVSSTLPLKISPSIQLCSVCKENEAMPDGLYCGNACIVRYVVASVESMNKSYEEPLPEDQKIIVHDRKKQHTITGMRGPSISELPRWLADHPSFEIVKPSAFPMRPPGRELKVLQKPVTIEPLKTPVKMKDPPTPVTNKPKQAPAVKVKSSNESVESSQTTLKQFFGDKSKVKKSADAAGNVNVKEGSSLKLGEVKKDVQAKMKDKEKQRPIKLIPPQPVQKPAEEVKDTGLVTRTPTTPKPPASSPVTKKPVVPTPSSAEKGEKTPVKRKSEPPKKEKPTKKPAEMKRQDSKKNDDDLTSSEAPSESGVNAREHIRKSCRIALNELFISRMKDVSDINVREDELTTLANQVEDELFNLFNDTNTKYKSKYRSLRFNIKDQKNTLFRRIAERSLRPYDLVRLTPEELASTELAQWREREAKHEIDMIKKTELENLNQAKVLVLKTHKGELEIESEALPTAPDTVVPDLQPDELPVEADKSKKSLTLKIKTSSKDKDSAKDASKKDRDKDRHKKHDHKDRHKSSSSSHKHRHRSRSRRRSKSKEGGKSAEKKDHRSSKSSADKKHDSKSSSEKDRHRSRHRSRSRSRRRKEKTPEKKEESSLLVTEGTEAPSDIPVEKRENKMIIDKEDEKIAAEILSSYNPVDVDLSDMEPTSTVTIQTPPYAASPELPSFMWKGTLIMPDVTTLYARLREVSGKCEGLDEDLPGVIDCVGRINPQMMWDYISKTKKTGNREILVLRFEPVDDEQRANYFTLYSYLNRKDRMAVVGRTSPSIKDFYVIPLAGHSPIPQVLLPLDGPGFEDSRSHMLLGVIVRSRRHNHHHHGSSLLQSSHVSVRKEKETFIQPAIPPVIESQVATQSDTFTPPHSPTSALLGGLPKSPPITVPGNDDDEPYSPEDDEPYSPGALDEEQENDTSLDLQREMEALNRQIEEQKQQIENISSSFPQEETEEFYSPTEHFEPETSNVQLPGDLQQLLNSLNRRSNEAASNAPTDPIVDAYKLHVDSSDDEVEEVENELSRGESMEETLPPCFSPPDISKEGETGFHYEEKDAKIIEDSPESSIEEIPIPADPPEPVDDSRLNRDPRRKIAPTQPAVEPFRMLTSQPPPPGMEDEFPMSGGVNSEVGVPINNDGGAMVPMAPVTMTDAAYVTAVPASPFVYGTGAPLTAFPPPNMMPAVPPMYIPAPGVFPQATALPFAPIPPQQLYMTPAAVLPTDPSMIPLPVEPSDMKNALKRRSQEDDRDKDKDRDRRLGGGKNRKYYRDSKSPPGRVGYDSHYRGYRRSDDRDSRYGSSRHDRSYNRNRSGYWKSGGDYSSSSRRSRYSDRDRDRRSRSRSSSRSRSRERSSSKHSSRWDDASDSQKRDRQDRKSESSRRS